MNAGDFACVAPWPNWKAYVVCSVGVPFLVLLAQVGKHVFIKSTVPAPPESHSHGHTAPFGQLYS